MLLILKPPNTSLDNKNISEQKKSSPKCSPKCCKFLGYLFSEKVAEMVTFRKSMANVMKLFTAVSYDFS
jgi:hypothetical protein